MRVVNERTIETGNKILQFEIPIKKCIEFQNFFVVLIRDRKEIPNNIIAYNYDGDEMWKINDIVQAKVLRGYDDIVKKSENLIEVSYELGIIFEIDVVKKEIINKTFLR